MKNRKISKMLLGVLLSAGLILSSNVSSFASDDEFDDAIPQVIVDESETEVNGHVSHEYEWGNLPRARASESDQLKLATWKHHQLSAGKLSHRAAKIWRTSKNGWYACS